LNALDLNVSIGHVN